MTPHRRRLVPALALAAAALTTWPAVAFAGPVSPTLELTLGQSSISFPDANPDLVASVLATPALVPVTVRVTGNGGNQWRLTLVANDHLRSGAQTILASNVSWTSSITTSGFLAGGTLAVAAPQTVASGTGNINGVTSNLTFRLVNSWLYAPGVYTTTATFTLSAP